MTDDAMLRGFKAAMKGATPRLKQVLQAKVDAATYQAIRAAALHVLDHLPAGLPLGTRVAALMLAATAYAESGANARAFIDAHHEPPETE